MRSSNLYLLIHVMNWALAQVARWGDTELCEYPMYSSHADVLLQRGGGNSKPSLNSMREKVGAGAVQV